MKKQLLIIGIIFFAISIAARLLPHLPNFVPVTALALFAGVYLPRRWSLILPIVAMLLSDLIIGFYEPQVMLAVYGSFAITTMIGWVIKKHLNPANLFFGALANSVIFYLITNFAVWQFTQMYAPNMSGLMMSYAMAMPFFKWSLVGDLAWTAAFFGAHQLVIKWFPEATLSTSSVIARGDEAIQRI